MPQNLKYILVARYPTTVTEDYYRAGFLMTTFFFYEHTDAKKIFLTHTVATTKRLVCVSLITLDHNISFYSRDFTIFLVNKNFLEWYFSFGSKRMKEMKFFKF